MSTHPRIESRVSAQERRQLILDARIEELSEDMTASFKQLSEYLGKIEDRFDKIEATMATKEDLATMATKKELAAMENRILDSFKQLLAAINPQFPPSQ